MSVVRVQASALDVGCDVTIQRYSFFEILEVILHSSNDNHMYMYMYLTNKIPFLGVYGDINLVGHVIKSHTA